MADKRRYTVTLPDHVADAVEAHAKPLGATPTEYAGDVLRWWFGEGCPPVTHDETKLRKGRFPHDLTQRLKPVPNDLNARSLDPSNSYILTDDSVVQKLLNQLGLPNLFPQAAEHDVVRFSIAFDNHPTHWIVVDLYKGGKRPDENGLSFRAYPKDSTTREQMCQKLQAENKVMEASGPFEFSQIPLYEEKKTDNQTPNTTPSTSAKK